MGVFVFFWRGGGEGRWDVGLGHTGRNCSEALVGLARVLIQRPPTSQLAFSVLSAPHNYLVVEWVTFNLFGAI